MASIWFYGSAKRRSVKLLDDGTAIVAFSTSRRPLGSRIEPPDELGSTTVEHEEAATVLLSRWQATGEHGDGVEIEHVSRFADGTPDPTDRARDLGHGEIVAETAVRKRTDSEGGECTEHRFSVRIPIDGSTPLDSAPLGWMLKERRFALGIVLAQRELPAMPARKTRRTKDGEQELPLSMPGDGDAP